MSPQDLTPVARKPTGRAAKSYAIFAGKIALSAAIVWYAIPSFDPMLLASDVSGANPVLLPIAILQLLLIPILGGLRWWLILHALGYPQPIWPLTARFWIGMMFGQVLPTVASGDAIRIWLAWRGGLNPRTCVHSVMLERAAMLLTLVMLVALLQPLLRARLGLQMSAWLPPLILLVGLAGLGVLMIGDLVLVRWRSWAPIQALSHLSQDARELFLSSFALPLAALCFATHLNTSISAWWLGLALGLPLGFVDQMMFIPIVTLAAVLPISIGGWGVREGLMVTLLGVVGVTVDSALAFSILLGIAILISSLPGLPLLWLDPGRREDALAAPGATNG